MTNTPPSDSLEMPILKPVRMRTKRKGYVTARWRWLTWVRWWDVVEDWRHTLPGSEKHEIVIPKGFRFDAASIPRPFRFFLSPVGILLLPSLVHDFAYRYDFLLQQSIPGGPYTRCDKPAGRASWDRLFREMSTEINGFRVLNWIVWLMLRIGGRSSWRGRRKNPSPHYWERTSASEQASSSG